MLARAGRSGRALRRDPPGIAPLAGERLAVNRSDVSGLPSPSPGRSEPQAGPSPSRGPSRSQEPALEPATHDATDREERFAELVREHRDRAVGMAWRLLGGDRAAAEDVAQEAFARAYRGLDRFREDSQLSTWFYRILVREAGRYRRWRAVRERFGGHPGDADAREGEWADPHPDPQSDPLLRGRIADAVSRLSRGQREAFVMVHLEGMTVTQTAEVLERSPGTVKTHLHRALKALRRELADLVGDPGAPNNTGEESHEPVRA
ncbi:MAG: RNA polymerase sigma factor [Myxococcota bacterium]